MELTLDRRCFRMCSQKMVKPSRHGPIMERLVGSYLVSERRACRVLRLARATYRYKSCLDPRTELRMRIREIAQARVRYGYRKIRVLLNREGWEVGKYLVYRLYKEEGLMLKRIKPVGSAKRHGSVREVEGDGAGSGLEHGLHLGSVAGRDALSLVDDRGCLHPRSRGDRRWAEPEGTGHCRNAKPAEVQPWSSKGTVLRQRQRVHQSRDGPVGISKWSEDRLLQTK